MEVALKNYRICEMVDFYSHNIPFLCGQKPAVPRSIFDWVIARFFLASLSGDGLCVIFN